jgi:hypothetical protein
MRLFKSLIKEVHKILVIFLKKEYLNGFPLTI